MDLTTIVLIILFWGIPVMLIVTYIIASKICRTDIEIKSKGKKTRTKLWFHKRRLYRKVRKFLHSLKVFSPTVVIYLFPDSDCESFRQGYESSHVKLLEKAGYSVRVILMKK